MHQETSYLLVPAATIASYNSQTCQVTLQMSHFNHQTLKHLPY